MVGSMREQKGHWKSLKSWMTTFAFAPPLNGVSAEGAATFFVSGGYGPFAVSMILS